MRVVLYLHLGIGRGVEHNGHQRFLFNVYKRFFYFCRVFLRFLTFLFFFITFFTSMLSEGLYYLLTRYSSFQILDADAHTVLTF